MQAFGKESSRTTQDASRRQSVSSPEQIKGAEVLLAEDNEINQQIAKELLEKSGVVVHIANNGQEAVNMLDQQPFELVLMDIQMPLLDGYEATEKIRSQEQYKDLPIIAMTAHAMAGDAEKSFEAGMNGHITKPINPDELFTTLAKWIRPAERNTDGAAIPKATAHEAPEIVIPKIEGLDNEAGLVRVAGNKTLYRNLLTKFAHDYTDSRQQIEDALKKGERETAQRIAHTVKGVAGNIGIATVQNKAANLEAGIRDESNILDQQIIEFGNALSDATSRVAQALSDTEVEIEAENKNGNTETLRDFLDKLAPHVQKRKPKPCKEIVLEMEAFIWPDNVTDDVNDLMTFVSKYRFKEANASMDKLLNVLNKEEV